MAADHHVRRSAANRPLQVEHVTPTSRNTPGTVCDKCGVDQREWTRHGPTMAILAQVPTSLTGRHNPTSHSSDSEDAAAIQVSNEDSRR